MYRWMLLLPEPCNPKPQNSQTCNCIPETLKSNKPNFNFIEILYTHTCADIELRAYFQFVKRKIITIIFCNRIIILSLQSVIPLSVLKMLRINICRHPMLELFGTVIQLYDVFELTQIVNRSKYIIAFTLTVTLMLNPVFVQSLYYVILTYFLILLFQVRMSTSEEACSKVCFDAWVRYRELSFENRGRLNRFLPVDLIVEFSRISMCTTPRFFDIPFHSYQSIVSSSSTRVEMAIKAKLRIRGRVGRLQKKAIIVPG